MTRCKMAQPDDGSNIQQNIKFLYNVKNHTNGSSNLIYGSRTKEAASADEIFKAPLLGLSRPDCTQPSKNKNQRIDPHTQIIVVESKVVQTKF